MKNILVVASHVEPNDHNGASKYIKWIVSCIPSEFNVTVISCGGKWQDIGTVMEIDSGHLDSKKIALVKSLFSKHPYHSYRLCNPKTIEYLQNEQINKYDLIIVSFIHSYIRLSPLLKSFDGKILVITHNYDPDIYSVWNRLNFIQKIISLLDSFKYKFASHEPLLNNVMFAHVTESDRNKFTKIFPKVKHYIFPPPVPSSKSSETSIDDGVIRFCFIGSLATSFNVEALEDFASCFWPTLRKMLKSEFFVFGSHPSKNVISLCNDQGWELKADLSDDELGKQIAKMDIGVMPFFKTAGTKLKLMHYFSAGCAVCCTSEFPEVFYNGKKIAISSNDPNDWVIFSKEIQENRTSIKLTTRKAAQTEARNTKDCINSSILDVMSLPL